MESEGYPGRDGGGFNGVVTVLVSAAVSVYDGKQQFSEESDARKKES
jgi:hypothetical protein